MKVLYLGPLRPRMIDFIRSFGDDAVHFEDRISISSPVLNGIDFIVSYGYRYILPADVLNHFDRKAINMHVSFLPFNRGADPNLWSFLDDTPKGVTIHFMDAGLDTGEVIAQRLVHFHDEETLATSYHKLLKEIELLFFLKWPDIREGNILSFPQIGAGSFHRLADRETVKHLLVNGWDTSVKLLVGKARGMNGGA